MLKIYENSEIECRAYHDNLMLTTSIEIKIDLRVIKFASPTFVLPDVITTLEPLSVSFVGKLGYKLSQELMENVNADDVVQAFYPAIDEFVEQGSKDKLSLDEEQEITQYLMDRIVPEMAIIFKFHGNALTAGSTIDPNRISFMARKLPGVDFKICCPVKECFKYTNEEPLFRLIQHINDVHQWTREAIADWLETLELDLSF